jgi:hypothetical protein
MLSAGASVPREIEREAGGLLADLQNAGWNTVASLFDASFFGNWYVDLDRNGRCIRLVKDRSQYMITGPSTQEIKDVGLWRAFDDYEEFRRMVSVWAMQPDQNSSLKGEDRR